MCGLKVYFPFSSNIFEFSHYRSSLEVVSSANRLFFVSVNPEVLELPGLLLQCSFTHTRCPCIPIERSQRNQNVSLDQCLSSVRKFGGPKFSVAVWLPKICFLSIIWFDWLVISSDLRLVKVSMCSRAPLIEVSSWSLSRLLWLKIIRFRLVRQRYAQSFTDEKTKTNSVESKHVPWNTNLSWFPCLHTLQILY